MDVVGTQRSLYEIDEHQWMLEQIALLRAGKVEAIDRENLLAYLIDMTIRDRRELENRLIRLLQHMLKFRVQPDAASRSWRLTIFEQQRKITSMLTGTPSLMSYVPSLFVDAYPHAMKEAAAEIGMDQSAFPAQCPWTLEQCLAYEPPLV